ncbi:protein adenylyltransferase SelO [Vibrio vulnificus]|uniref:protein adenylyltransferase SelO n=1 Tax=Vibrio vulnificus TaxID=672 RepID=UPI0037DB1EB3
MSLWSSVKFAQRYAQLPTVFYRLVTPQPLDNSRWVIWNGELAQRFALPEHADDPQLLAVFSGAEPFSAFKPLAMKYAGHQFGVYNPDLGDGRGLLLAEMQNQQGQWFDIHLKGAGLTPFSRMGDGRAVLRSTLREYLCSEAMAALGIETTRALGMMVSDTPVYREQVEQGACLIRLAQTHIRFGHFEHFFYTEQYDELRLLADNVIEWYLPDCLHQPKPYLAMFEQVVAKTATMIAQWQAVGFAHGVMNTDNMSILGQTFDYGPFGFLDDYEPGYICNHSDYQGRYAFDQQPRVALWNLSALAHALSPLIERDDLELALAQYEPTLGKVFSQLMRQKLGLLSQQEGDSELFNAMFTLLAENHTDYTRFFRTLSQLDREDEQTVIDLFVDRDAAHGWLSRYLERVALEQTASGEVKSAQQRCEQMRAVNPKYILRNYLAQQAIDKAEQGDFSEVHTLAKLLKNPYDDQPEMEAYARLPPEWGKKMVISCSS